MGAPSVMGSKPPQTRKGTQGFPFQTLPHSAENGREKGGAGAPERNNKSGLTELKARDASCPKGKKMEQRKNLTTRNLEELVMKKMIMALCIFICVFTLVACSGQQTNEPLTLGVNAIITEIDKENRIITTKDSGEEGVLGNDCLIDCSKIPMIYCNYDTQDVVDITFDDLQVGDEIILTIRSSEIENLQKEDDNKAKIAVEQLQLGTQRIK